MHVAAVAQVETALSELQRLTPVSSGTPHWEHLAVVGQFLQSEVVHSITPACADAAAGSAQKGADLLRVPDHGQHAGEEQQLLPSLPVPQQHQHQQEQQSCKQAHGITTPDAAAESVVAQQPTQSPAAGISSCDANSGVSFKAGRQTGPIAAEAARGSSPSLPASVRQGDSQASSSCHSSSGVSFQAESTVAEVASGSPPSMPE